MWVCLCRGVTDSQVRAAVDAGARSIHEVGRQCGAGTGCGGCLPEVRRLMRNHRAFPGCFDCPELHRPKLNRTGEAVSIPA